ncbi:MAG: transposase family protein [Acidimicrobiia bacterium]|nr:transposase family protein [Acidimicrobiia bacterium]
MRVKKVLMAVLGLCRETVVRSWELHDGERPRLEVRIRAKVRRRGRCGRCGELAGFYDQGGGERRWRHIDVGFATCELVAGAPRVDCAEHGPTVAAVRWARHDSAFTRAFEDLVVHDAIVGNKQAAADRYGISWRAVNNMCARVATEALGRVDLLDGLVAIAIDEVKYKKGHKYLVVTWNQREGWMMPPCHRVHELRGPVGRIEVEGEVAGPGPARACRRVARYLDQPGAGSAHDRRVRAGAG